MVLLVIGFQCGPVSNWVSAVVLLVIGFQCGPVSNWVSAVVLLVTGFQCGPVTGFQLWSYQLYRVASGGTSTVFSHYTQSKTLLMS